MALPLIVVISTVVSAVAGQVILSDLTDRTVFLDDEAFFLCVTRGSSSSHWRLNGIDYNDLPSDVQDDLVIDSSSSALSETLNLLLPAKTEYNETRVECVAENNDEDSVVSDTATLYIQGILSSVSNVTVMNNISSITISWNAPFSLDVTDVDPDIWYSVLIYNMTADEPTVISCTDCVNITETYYTFTPDCPSPCHKYIFTIFPFNGAGQGQSSENITDNDIPDITITRVDIRTVNRSTSTVIFSVSGEVERVCDYTLHAVSDDGDGRKDIISEKNSSILEDEGNITYTLSANRYYSIVYIEIETSGGSDVIHQDNFTTFDLQNPSAEGEKEEMISVSGTFITNSLARGCFLVIQCNEDTADIFVAIEREGSDQIVNESIPVPPSSYIVYAYDLEENTLPHRIPAYSPSPEIIINTPYIEPNTTSEFLDSATITVNGSEVIIDCTFANISLEEPSCVLVYREYDNSTLIMRPFYKSNTSFPVSITIDNPEGKNYTFAIFGRDGSTNIDRIPLTSTRVMFETTDPTSMIVPTPSETITPTHGTTTLSLSVAVIVAVVVIVTIIIMTVTLILIVMVYIVFRRNQRNKVILPMTVNTNSHNPVNIELDMRSDEITDGDNDIKREEDSGSRSTTQSSVVKEITYATLSEMKETKPSSKEPLPKVPPVKYEDIDVKATQELQSTMPPTDSTVNDDKKIEKKGKGFPTKDEVMSLLYAIADQWKTVANGLGMDEDWIDEIDTNNAVDILCLDNIVDVWIQRMRPTWKKLSLVLRDIGRNDLADKAWNDDHEKEEELKRQTNGFQWMLQQTTDCECDNESDDEMVVGLQRQTLPVTEDVVDDNRGGKGTVSSGGGGGWNGLSYQSIYNKGMEDEVEYVNKESIIPDQMIGKEVYDEMNGNTADEPCVESINSSQEEEGEDNVHDVAVVVVGETTQIISSYDMYSICYTNDKPLIMSHGVCVLDEKYVQELNACNEEVVMMCSEGDDVTPFEFVCDPLTKPNPENNVVGDRKFNPESGSVIMSPVVCTNFNGLAVTDRADEINYGTSEMDTPLKDVNCLEELTRSYSTGEMIAPSLPTKLYHFDKGMVGTGVESSNNNDKVTPDLKLQQSPLPSPPETTHCQPQQDEPQIYSYTEPTQAPPSQCPPKQALKMKNTKLSSEKLPSQKRQYNDPPDNYREKIQKWYNTGTSLGFNGPGYKLCFWGLPLY